MEGMRGIREEFEEYLERGFPEEIAVLKAVAHYFASGVPGVWREIESVIREIAWKREEIIYAVPEKFRGAVRELLACTRTIKEMCNEEVGWGWFSVTKVEEGKYCVISSNKTLPYIVGVDVEEINEFEFEFSVNEGGMVMLFSQANQDANFEIVGILTKYNAWLLEVRLSERGKKALNKLEEMIGW